MTRDPVADRTPRVPRWLGAISTVCVRDGPPVDNFTVTGGAQSQAFRGAICARARQWQSIECPSMADARTWSATIPLARDRWRVFALVGSRAAIGIAGVATSRGTPGTLGMALLVISVIVLAYLALLTLWLATVRAEVFAGRVDLVWALWRQRYPLVPGPITRVRPGRGRKLLDASRQVFGMGPRAVRTAVRR